jgi:glyoxylase-like metal-dependent hydrolase (beta-lactamase superfamily II)
MTKVLKVLARLTGVVVASLAASAVAQAPLRPAFKVDPPFRVEQLRPAVALLVGAGGNTTIGYGAAGVAIVDDKIVEASDQMLAELKKVDPRPVGLVINTHWHFDHAGGNEALAKQGAVVIAHANVKVRMAKGGTIVMGARSADYGPSPAIALPVRTYEKELTVTGGGDTLRLVHVPNAHTDGDTIVKWTHANVLDMGDVYVRYGLPFIDIRSGGTLRGMIKCVEVGLAMTDDQTIVVPGHGAPATRADLMAYRDALVRIADAVDAGVRAGKSLAEVQALRPADDFPKPPGTPLTPNQFVATAYENAAQAAARAGAH